MSNNAMIEDSVYKDYVLKINNEVNGKH